MQILTDGQVKYCSVVQETIGALEYLLGISFQHKIFLKQNFFPAHELDNARNYCQQKYLDAAGKRLYLLVKDTTGFEVWVEAKSARVLGDRDPRDLVEKFNLENLVDEIREVAGIEFDNCQDNLQSGDRHTVKSKANGLINTLEVSLRQALDLGQRIINEEWIYPAVEEQFFPNERVFPYFCNDD
jgi:hypothetical protein